MPIRSAAGWNAFIGTDGTTDAGLARSRGMEIHTNGKTNSVDSVCCGFTVLGLVPRPAFGQERFVLASGGQAQADVVMGEKEQQGRCSSRCRSFSDTCGR